LTRARHGSRPRPFANARVRCSACSCTSTTTTRSTSSSRMPARRTRTRSAPNRSSPCQPRVARLTPRGRQSVRVVHTGGADHRKVCRVPQSADPRTRRGHASGAGRAWTGDANAPCSQVLPPLPRGQNLENVIKDSQKAPSVENVKHLQSIVSEFRQGLLDHFKEVRGRARPRRL